MRSTDAHPSFKILLEDARARSIRAVSGSRKSGWLASALPISLENVSFTQFDQSLWELYLWAAMREWALTSTQPEAPDFSVERRD